MGLLNSTGSTLQGSTRQHVVTLKELQADAFRSASQSQNTGQAARAFSGANVTNVQTQSASLSQTASAQNIKSVTINAVLSTNASVSATSTSNFLQRYIAGVDASDLLARGAANIAQDQGTDQSAFSELNDFSSTDSTASNSLTQNAQVTQAFDVDLSATVVATTSSVNSTNLGNTEVLTSNLALTTAAGTADSTTLLSDINNLSGGGAFQATDVIDISGTDANSGTITGAANQFTLGANSTLGDLFTAIDSAFNTGALDVTTSINSSGNIVLTANAGGDVPLDLALTVTTAGAGAAAGALGTIAVSTAGTNVFIGADAFDQSRTRRIAADISGNNAQAIFTAGQRQGSSDAPMQQTAVGNGATANNTLIQTATITSTGNDVRIEGDFNLALNDSAALSQRTAELLQRITNDSAVNSSAASQDQVLIQNAAGGVDEEGNISGNGNGGDAQNSGASTATNTESTNVLNSITITI